jgi:prepilin-type N-terminal cleavage/methylation domain-containing protein
VRSSRAGFTLIELMVAIVIAGIVAVGAHSVFLSLTDQARRTASAAANADADANGERLLRALVGRMQIMSPTAIGIFATERSARFATWCDTPGGWQEPCSVTIAVLRSDSVRAEPVLAAILSATDTVPLRRGFAAARLRYLRSASDGGRWDTTWELRARLPIAIGIMTDLDTMIVRIGDRG